MSAVSLSSSVCGCCWSISSRRVHWDPDPSLFARRRRRFSRRMGHYALDSIAPGCYWRRLNPLPTIDNSVQTSSLSKRKGYRRVTAGERKAVDAQASMQLLPNLESDMVARRFVLRILLLATAVSFFTAWHDSLAQHRPRVARRLRREARRHSCGVSKPTMRTPCRPGWHQRPPRAGDAPSSAPASRARVIAEIKSSCRTRWGCCRCTLCATALELRRALFVRQSRKDQLRHRGLSRTRLLHHREARRRCAQG